MRFEEAILCADRDPDIRITQLLRPSLNLEFSMRSAGQVCVTMGGMDFMHFTPHTHGFTLVRDNKPYRHAINQLLPYGKLTREHGRTYLDIKGSMRREMFPGISVVFDTESGQVIGMGETMQNILESLGY